MCKRKALSTLFDTSSQVPEKQASNQLPNRGKSLLKGFCSNTNWGLSLVGKQAVQGVVWYGLLDTNKLRQTTSEVRSFVLKLYARTTLNDYSGTCKIMIIYDYI